MRGSYMGVRASQNKVCSSAVSLGWLGSVVRDESWTRPRLKAENTEQTKRGAFVPRHLGAIGVFITDPREGAGTATRHSPPTACPENRA